MAAMFPVLRICKVTLVGWKEALRRKRFSAGTVTVSGMTTVCVLLALDPVTVML